MNTHTCTEELVLNKRYYFKVLLLRPPSNYCISFLSKNTELSRSTLLTSFSSETAI